MATPSVDATLAQKIIDGRPYQRKKGLITKQVVSQATYNTINHQIIVKVAKK